MRLSNQGLGCDDWPDCYGRIDVVKYAGDIAATTSRSLQPGTLAPPTAVERAHRGVASALLVLIVALVIVAWRKRKDSGLRIMALPLAALAVTLSLAVLGVLYGSPLLRPPVVMANLLGGMVLLGLLWWLHLSLGQGPAADISPEAERLRKWALLGLALVVTQTALGGWVSSNFSALACPTFPLCNGVLWPEMDMPAGFTLRHLLLVSPEGRVVVEPAATLAVHMVHRLGALFVVLFVGWLGYRALKRDGRIRRLGRIVFVLLGLQVLLGMAVVVFSAPLGLVVTHNATAALLWLTLLALIHRLSKSRPAVETA